MNYYKNKVSWCPICDQGWVEIYKDKKTGNLFVICDECDSMWKHPDELKDFKKLRSVFNTDTEEMPKDEEDASLFEWDVEIQQPTDEEIRVKGWDKYIIEN